MRLSHLLQDILTLPSSADREIAHITLDSRKVGTNDVFVALKGSAVDGRQFIAKAIQQGATAVLVDAAKDEEITWQDNVPLIPVARLSSKLGEIAARFYDYPAKKLFMIGITGTNGKTSISHFIAQLFQSLHVPCGVIGTLGSGLYGQLGEAGLTTPDPITLQALLQKMHEQGAKVIAMEVSSHSIDQGRVNGIEFNISLFTNLTQDHLDYHGDMATYANVKKRFIFELPNKAVVINADDAIGRQWISELPAQKKQYAYSVDENGRELASIYTTDIQLSLQGIKANVHTPWGDGQLQTPIIGQFNLSNLLAVLTTLCIYGIPLKEVLQQFALLKPVPGRMQTLGGKDKPLAVVDYSHTPDALEKALQTLRAHTMGKLICVFGCGGDRDHSKRPLMANIAEQLADIVIVTNDNPRHEQPDFILQQIMQGFAHPELVFVELDRAKAIQNSIQLAKAQDCILIAGKGAEKYQQIGDEKFPFDDIEEVNRCLNINNLYDINS